jgi:hypothetical protein
VPIGESRKGNCHVRSSETGFLEGCKVVFQPWKKSSDHDYNSDVNANDFLELAFSFLNTLDKLNIHGVVILMHSGSYHSVIVGKAHI